MSKALTVTKVTANSTGKILFVDGTVEGHAVKLKAWASGPAKDWAEGQVVEIEVEKKPGYNGGPEETWVKEPPKSGGRSGGAAAKSDPAKNKVIEESNKRNNAAVLTSNTLNNAKDVVGMAVGLVGKGADINQVETVADQLASIVLKLQQRFQEGL